MFVDQRTAITILMQGTLKERARGAKMERVVVKDLKNGIILLTVSIFSSTARNHVLCCLFYGTL